VKICILRHSKFPPDATVMRELNCLLDAGHEVDVICLRHAGQAALETYRDKGRFIRIPLEHKRGGIFRYVMEYMISFVMMTVLVAILHARRRYDCVQVNTMPDFLVFAACIPKLFGAKVLLHLHEPTPELWMTKFGFGQSHPLFRLQVMLEQWAIRYADMALTVSDSLKARYGERGASLSKITVLPNVCDERYEKTLPSRQPVKDGHFRLLTHGLIEERYGHELALQAVKSLEQEIPMLRYRIPGEGEYAPAVASRIRELQLDGRVTMEGWVPFEDLIQFLHECDAGIVPMQRSPYSELIDTCKMYEFIALRKPVIVSRLPTVEAHFDDSCVMFFEPGNASDLARCIRQLHGDERKRKELADNAFRRYEKLKWSVTKRDYLDVLENLVSKPDQSRFTEGEPVHATEDIHRNDLV
jgi:glycosyltransferase involved in cell wall biosynthesis